MKKKSGRNYVIKRANNALFCVKYIFLDDYSKIEVVLFVTLIILCNMKEEKNEESDENFRDYGISYYCPSYPINDLS